MSNENHYLWNETYRPRKIADCILPKALKETFQAMVDKGDVPNITLSGPAGVGKTTGRPKETGRRNET